MKPHAPYQMGADISVPPAPTSGPAALIRDLSSTNPRIREQARDSLVEIGSPAVPELLIAFQSDADQTHWEACKALAEIADPAAVIALAQGLEDQHQDVRWVSAEGLLNIGKPAVEPLLHALIDRSRAHTILDGALHVFRGLARRATEPIFDPIIIALRGPEPAVNVPPAAETLLITWQTLMSEVAAGHRRPVLRTFRNGLTA